MHSSSVGSQLSSYRQAAAEAAERERREKAAALLADQGGLNEEQAEQERLLAASNAHHQTVCLITTSYPLEDKGSGFFVHLDGLLCVVAGSHLLSGPAAALSCLVHFFTPGEAHPAVIRLLPAVLFKPLAAGALAACACDYVETVGSSEIDIDGVLKAADPISEELQDELEMKIIDAWAAKDHSQQQQLVLQQRRSHHDHGALGPPLPVAELVCHLNGGSKQSLPVTVDRLDHKRLHYSIDPNESPHEPNENNEAAIQRGQAQGGQSPATNAAEGQHGAPLFFNKQLLAVHIQPTVDSPATFALLARDIFGAELANRQLDDAVRPETSHDTNAHGKEECMSSDEEDHRQDHPHGSGWGGIGRGQDGSGCSPPLAVSVSSHTKRRKRKRASSSLRGRVDKGTEVRDDGYNRYHDTSYEEGEGEEEEEEGEEEEGLPSMTAVERSNGTTSTSSRVGSSSLNSAISDHMGNHMDPDTRYQSHGQASLLQRLLDLIQRSNVAALRRAARRDGVETLRSLRTGDGKGLAHLAALLGKPDVLKVLACEMGFDIVSDTTWLTGDSVAHAAAYGGHTGVLRLLALAGADLSLRNKRGMSPVHLAVLRGHEEAVTWLATEGGVDVGASLDRAGQSPLDLADDMRDRGVGGVIKLLKEKRLREGQDGALTPEAEEELRRQARERMDHAREMERRAQEELRARLEREQPPPPPRDHVIQVAEDLSSGATTAVQCYEALTLMFGPSLHTQVVWGSVMGYLSEAHKMELNSVMRQAKMAGRKDRKQLRRFAAQLRAEKTKAREAQLDSQMRTLELGLRIDMVAAMAPDDREALLRKIEGAEDLLNVEQLNVKPAVAAAGGGGGAERGADGGGASAAAATAAAVAASTAGRKAAVEELGLNPGEQVQLFTSMYIRDRLSAQGFHTALLEHFGPRDIKLAMPRLLQSLPEAKAVPLLALHNAHRSAARKEKAQRRHEVERAAAEAKTRAVTAQINKRAHDPFRSGEVSRTSGRLSKLYGLRPKDMEGRGTVTNNNNVFATNGGGGEDQQEGMDGGDEVMSMGSMGSLQSLETDAGQSPDVDEGMERYRGGLLTAEELYQKVLKPAFGSQTTSVMPRLLATFDEEQYEDAYDQHEQKEGEEEEEGGVAVGKRAMLEVESGGAREKARRARAKMLKDGLEKVYLADKGARKKTTGLRGKAKEREREALKQAEREAREKEEKRNRFNPFRGRQGGWSKDNSAEQKEREGAAAAAAAAAEAAAAKRKKRKKSKKSTEGKAEPDVKALVEAYGAGQIAVSSFFGELEEFFGETKTLKMIPGLAKLLPPPKAAELTKFVEEAGGEAGAASKERKRVKDEKKRREEEEKRREEEEKEKKRKAALDDEERAREEKEEEEARRRAEEEEEKAAEAARIEAERDPEDEKWAMSEGQRKGYLKGFKKLDKDGNGLLSQQEVAKVMDKSGLDRKTLKAAWRLAEKACKEEEGGSGQGVGDTGGELDKAGWAVMQHLMACLSDEANKKDGSGWEVPHHLPSSLGGKKRKRKTSAAIREEEAKALSKSLAKAEAKAAKVAAKARQKRWTKALHGLHDPEDVRWGMTEVQREAYEKTFNQLDRDQSGSLSGSEARPLLVRSGLGVADLKKVWRMADVDKDGCLNKEEWSTTMHLIVMLRRGAKKNPKWSLPEKLPHSLGGKKPRKKVKGVKVEDSKALAEVKAALLAYRDGERPAKELVTRDLAPAYTGDWLLLAMESVYKCLEAYGPPPPDGTEAYGQDGGEEDGDGSGRLVEKLRKEVGRWLREFTEYGEEKAAENFLVNDQRAQDRKQREEDEREEAERLAKEEEEMDKWQMGPGDRKFYDQAFKKLDKDRDGFVTWAETAKMFEKGGLSDTENRLLYSLADMDGDNRLNQRELAICFHLVRCISQRKLDVPDTLPVSLQAM